MDRASCVDTAVPSDDLFVVDPTNGSIYLLTGIDAVLTRRVIAYARPTNDDPTHRTFATSSAVSPERVTYPNPHSQSDPEMIDALSHRQRPMLEAREATILQLVADGHSNEAIASMLHFSVATVRRSTTSLYRRLGARNRASAIARAHALQLLT